MKKSNIHHLCIMHVKMWSCSMTTDFIFAHFLFFSLKMEVKLENMRYLLNLTSLNLILEHTEVKSPRRLLDQNFQAPVRKC